MPGPGGSYNVSHQRQVMGSMGASSSGSQGNPFGGPGGPGVSWMANNGWLSVSPVEALVQRACDPSLSEPPYQVHVELSELIANKKANTPREAIMAAVRLVNHRNPHVSILALALIDSLVQSGGYPIHLQVATKEFLNELVRRFPERPPPFPGPVMQRILELIHSWKEGICAQSRWKDDLGNIRDMHRLLSFKGYRFRDLPRTSNSNNITNVESLKSPEELENEDREAQSAKLQELLRRGTPKDLAAAQELMKVLAGADPEQKPDYKAQTLKELNKVEAKVILLNEMLDNVDVERGEKFAPGDVYEQVAESISAATPKIQGWISDAEAHEPESLATFLQINDQINNVIARYEAFKKGDYTAASNPVPPELAGPPAKDSLIDLMDDENAAAATTTTTGTGGVTDDLAGLFGPSTTTTDSSPPASLAQRAGQVTKDDIMGRFNQAQSQGLSQPRPMAMGASSFSGYGADATVGGMRASPGPLFQGGGQIMLPGTPQSQLKGLSGSRTGTPSLSGSTTLQPQQPQQPQQQQQAQQPAQQTNQKDPFADLAGLW
ncbi:VHS-domain-containing protein [Serendipita vermifera]|nr:VHS-domain-containing protein [Serendipita vermifera]